MADILSFLFNGTPPKSVTTYGTSTASVPQWVSDLQQGIAQKAVGIAGTPYQPYGGPRIAGFNADQQSSFDMTRDSVGDQAGNFNAATAAAGAAGANANASGASQPWLDKAGAASYENVQNYMNPFMNNVTDRIADLGARNLNEKLMPAINSDFIRAGQYGSKGQMAEVGKALRDTQGEVTAAQGDALFKGYQSSLDAAGADANRYGQIGQTAAANSNMDTEAKLAAAGKQGVLAQLAQDSASKDADALRNVGNIQQGQTQSNLDMANRDFVEQRDYQENQLNWLNSILKGFEVPKSTSTTDTRPLAADQYGASPLEQGLGAGLSAYQLLNGK